MITIKYLGPADIADLGPALGKPEGTEKYIFHRKRTVKLSKADAEEILTRDWRREGPEHRFVVVESDTSDIPTPEPPQAARPPITPVPPAPEGA